MLLKSLFQHMSPEQKLIYKIIYVFKMLTKNDCLKKKYPFKNNSLLVLYLGKRRFAKESKILTKKAGTMFKQ